MGDAPIATQGAIETLVYALLESVFPVSKGIRLLGVTLSSLDNEPEFRVGQQLLLPLQVEMSGPGR